MTDTDFRVSTTSPSQWGRVLSIEVPRAQYAAARAAVSRDLQKRVVRPGFRKGHVPAGLVERDFALKIEETTLEKFIPSVADKAIEREGLDVISQPRVRNLSLDDPEVVKFEVLLDVRPQIELRPLDGLKGTRWTASLTDEHLARALGELQDQQAQFGDVDRAAQDGDYVVVAYVPLDDAGVERLDQRVENYPFQLGSGGVVAEFEQVARGRKVGESGRTEVHYPESNENPDLAGKTVAFQVTVQAVKEKRVPAADDDLARDLGMEDFATLQAHIRQDLERRVKEESERDLRESLIEDLLATNPFDAPESMVEQYLEAVRADWEERRKRMHLPAPEAAEREQFLQEARPAAARFVKRGLLLDKLGQEHGIQVSEEDVDKWIEEKVLAGGSGSADVRAYFADARRRRRLRSELTEERSFDFLKSKARIEEVSRSVPAPGAEGQ